MGILAKAALYKAYEHHKDKKDAEHAREEAAKHSHPIEASPADNAHSHPEYNGPALPEGWSTEWSGQYNRHFFINHNAPGGAQSTWVPPTH